LPYPLTSGKRIRTMGLIQRLAARHRLTWVCHRNADREEARKATDYFNQLGIRTITVERTVPKKSGVGFYARLAANLFSPLPYSVAAHTSPQLIATLRALAARENIDLWHCEWTPYAKALESIPGRKLVMAHNVESVIWQRYRDTERNPLKRWYIHQQYRKFAAFEKQALSKAALTVAVSELDAQRFTDDFAVPNVAVVSNGVDTAFFHPSRQPREKATLVFTGSLDWRPNLDGLAQFLDGAWPKVRAALPDAEFDIVGRNPPEWLRQKISQMDGVQLHANVPDVRPFLHSASLMVVPLRIGGGSRLKILEGLACGTPVVSTRVGAEGLHLTPGRDFVQCEEIEDLSEVLIEALRDPETSRTQAKSGREQVLQNYDWDILAKQLERLWYGCVEQVSCEAQRSRVSLGGSHR
jgi:glycosyltransferase involved in cell wall biosynthesis